MASRSSSAAYGQENSWFDLSKSGYAKVIFSDLYHNPNSSVGCKFFITDDVHEDPADYIGLFKVGYESLDQCIVSKLLSCTEEDEDGKLLRCTFKCKEMPGLESGFYQFLYITRDGDVCGASLPFEIKISPNHPFEDIVADKVEDDFLVVRSTLAEKNRSLQSQITKMNHDGILQEKEFTECIAKFQRDNKHLEKQLKLVCHERETISIMLKKLEEESKNLDKELKRAWQERNMLADKCKRMEEEKNTLSKSNDQMLQNIEQQFKGLELKFEEAEKKINETEKIKENLERDKYKICEERNMLANTVNSLTKELDVQGLTIELLQKELKAVAENSHENRSSVATELDDAKLMISALEDSKLLVMNEVTQLRGSNDKLKHNQKQLRDQNVYLDEKVKVKDTLITQLMEQQKELKEKNANLEVTSKEKDPVIEKLMEQKKELKNKNSTLEVILKEKEALIEKLDESVREFRCESVANKLKLQDEKALCEKIRKKYKNLKSDVAALKLHFGDVEKASSSSVKKQKYSVNKVQFAADTQFSSPGTLATDEPKILNTDSAEIKTESADCQLDELNQRLIEKDSIISKLKEDCLKKDAVVEYLSKEKDIIQKNKSVVEEALSDSMIRLQDAAKIYKKQFLEIEKLKKKVDKTKSRRKKNCSESSSAKGDISSSECADEPILKANVPVLAQKPCGIQSHGSSDSDTGEHDLGLEPKKISNLPITEENDDCQSLSSEASSSKRIMTKEKSDVPNPNRIVESTELQSLMDKNLADLSSSKPKEDEQFSIPCPICDADIGICAYSSEEMIKHLEMQHKQQMCPICSKLFDMTLPEKYFEFHVMDHFMKEKKK